MCVEQGCLLWWQDRAGFLDEWRNAFWSKFFSETPCKSFPILATPYLAKSSSKFLNHMVDEKEILQDSTWQNIYLWKTNIAQLWWAPLIRVCFKHFKDILTPKFCALCLVRTHPPHITAETTFPTKLFFFFFIFSIFLLFFFSFFFVFLYFCIFVPSTSNIHQRKQAAPKIWHSHRIHWRRNMLTEWIVVWLPTHKNFDVRPLEIEFLKRWWWWWQQWDAKRNLAWGRMVDLFSIDQSWSSAG